MDISLAQSFLCWVRKRFASQSLGEQSILPGLYSEIPIVDLLQHAEQMADLGFARYDLRTAECHWSPGVFAIHDLPTTHSVKIDDAMSFYPPDHREIIEAAFDEASENGTGWDLELDLISARNRKKRVRAFGQAERVEGKVTALVCVFQDVTQRYEADRQLRQAALTDELTGLANRRHLYQAYDRLLREAPQNEPAQFALALIDLDHFKQINDRHGHIAGDEVLLQTGARLQAPWLTDSFAARLGGDEFVLVMRDKKLLDTLEKSSDRLLQELSRPIKLESGMLNLGATIGIAHVECDAPPLTYLLSIADTVLYIAKKQRRGSCMIAAAADILTGDDQSAQPQSEQAGFASDKNPQQQYTPLAQGSKMRESLVLRHARPSR